MIEKKIESPGYLKSMEIKGGAGSGNFGHGGRPGKIGGSAGGTGGGAKKDDVSSVVEKLGRKSKHRDNQDSYKRADTRAVKEIMQDLPGCKVVGITGDSGYSPKVAAHFAGTSADVGKVLIGNGYEGPTKYSVADVDHFMKPGSPQEFFVDKRPLPGGKTKVYYMPLYTITRDSIEFAKKN